MENTSTISLNVGLDENKWPETITWSATQSEVTEPTPAKAFMLSLWDGAEASALRIDLWTKTMAIDEMNDFFFQTFMTMADTYTRAVNNPALSEEIKTFAKQFHNKAIAHLEATNKPK
jgi:gliding motility-associated protein GldC